MAETGITRDQLRSGRKLAYRSRTLPGRVSLQLLRELRQQNARDYPRDVRRPETRADCVGGVRPCPFVSCRHHLYLDTNDVGGVKLNFPDIEVWEMGESCSLDVAGRGGVILEKVAELMNITRERIRQLENRALGKVAEPLRTLWRNHA